MNGTLPFACDDPPHLIKDAQAGPSATELHDDGTRAGILDAYRLAFVGLSWVSRRRRKSA